MSRELDTRIAERVMGLTPTVDGYRTTDYTYLTELPHYSADIAAAQKIEVEIERRGLQVRYVDALVARVTTTESIVEDIIALHGTSDALIMWRILRATPEQRCKAALRAATREGT
jgi:hypothetical protein